MRSRRSSTWVALALMLVACPRALAQVPAARGPEGIWQGRLQGIRLVVHIGRAGENLHGTLDSPDQGAMGIAIDTVSFAADSLRFEIRRMAAGFAGRLEATADSITGQWRQGGFVLPLALTRIEKAPALRRPQEPQRPYPYDTVEVSYPNAKAGVHLAGTLTVPRGAGPFPCALLITGSGAEDRDEAIFGHRPFLVLADHLTRHGVAVLRVDDRGVGGSTGGMATSTSEDFAGDVLAGIDFLKGQRRVDAKRIGLVGHSEGGLIAPMAAIRSKNVAFIVLMAAPGVPGDSILILQSAALRRLSGASEDLVAREGVARRRIHDLIRAGADSVAILPAVRALLDAQVAVLGEEQRRAIGDLDSLARLASRQFLAPWLRFFVTYDPRPALRRVRCPVLALNGTKDVQVPPRENLAAIEVALRAGGNREVTAVELAGLNHLFQTAGTGSVTEYGQIEETIAPAALEAISAWIVARTSPKR